MARGKANTDRQRRNYILPTKHVDMLQTIRRTNKMNSEAEALRWCIAQTFHLQKMLDEGCKIKIVEKDGREAAIIFV